MVAGAFQTVHARPREGIAAVDTRTQRAIALTVRIGAYDDPAVAAVAVWRGALLLAGPFRSVDGVRRLGLAALDRRTGRLLPWHAGLTWRGRPGAGRSLLVNGEFHTAAGQPRAGVAAVDARTGALLPGVPQAIARRPARPCPVLQPPEAGGATC
jgi:hypothetical protein